MSGAARDQIPLQIPHSSSLVDVSIIDTTSRIQGIPASVFIEPNIKGFDHFDCPAFSFLVKHKDSKRTVLWDLGVRKDWEKLAPRIVKNVEDGGWKLTIEKGVAEILSDSDISPADIEAIIWR